MEILRAYGYAAQREAWLGWILIAISVVTVLVVSGLVLAGSLRQRGEESRQLGRGRRGIPWVVIGGVAFPVVVLAGVIFLTFTTLTAVARPAGKPALTVSIVGHQWWWEVRYPGESPDRLVTTANEIHLPVGKTVRVEVTTADVIHSFWTPSLAGKLDLIPGQRNVLWLRADSVGVYPGQCAEYCGGQHANMRSLVVAESSAAFTRWLDAQRQPSAVPSNDESARGQEVFVRSACALCHTIRGTDAGGRLGPDLTHLASRATIAAGTLRNNRGNLAGWIANPQELKPGTLMPAVPLTPSELRALVLYLETLR